MLSRVPIQWWGYVHVSGSYHPKRYWDDKDLDSARESDFVLEVHGPFEAVSRHDALKKLVELHMVGKCQICRNELRKGEIRICTECGDK